MLVASPASREQPRALLEQLGYTCTDADDPYAAMAELARRSSNYRAVIISLSSLYREELAIIAALRQRFPQVEVWLAHTDGRQAALAQAMSMGADGLLAEDGLHRIGISPVLFDTARPTAVPHPSAPPYLDREQAEEHDFSSDEPVLTAEELRMLLQEQPASPPSAAE